MPKPLPSNIRSGPGLGASGRPGPQGAAGPGFTASVDLSGTSEEQAVIGFRERPLSTDAPNIGEAYVWNGFEFDPAPVGGGVGTVIPLSNVIYIDGGTSTPILDQDGGIGSPFDNLEDGLDFASGIPYPGATILITPGDYTGEGPLNWSGAGNPPTLLRIICIPQDVLGLGAAAILPELSLSGDVEITGCFLGTVTASSGGLTCRDCTLGPSVGGSGESISLYRCYLAGTIPCNTLFVEDSLFEGGSSVINCSSEGVTILNSRMGSAIQVNFTGPAGILTLDSRTNQQFQNPDNLSTLTNGSILLAETDATVVTDATTERTLIITDSNAYIRYTSNSPVDIIVPEQVAVRFPIGTTITHRQVGTGQLTLVPDGSVVLNSSETLKTLKQGSTISQTKIGEDEWDVTGERELSP